MEVKFYGVDVSKSKLDVACDGLVKQIENSSGSVKGFVKTMPAGSYVVMEATNTYHLKMADICYGRGVRVFVVNPRLTRRYREANGLRGHNDRMDARTLARYIEREHEGLREYVPKSADQRRLETLLRRRWKLVGVRTQLAESLGSIEELRGDLEALMGRIEALISKMEMLIDKQLEGDPGRARLLGVPGIGRIVSAALIADLDRCCFGSADAFVAYYGLDPIPNDSGRRRGIRKLSKQGQRLGRAMVYNAALAAVRTKVWKPIHEKCLARGLTRVQALVAVARKITRTAWSIYTHKTTFSAERLCRALT